MLKVSKPWIAGETNFWFKLPQETQITSHSSFLVTKLMLKKQREWWNFLLYIYNFLSLLSLLFILWLTNNFFLFILIRFSKNVPWLGANLKEISHISKPQPKKTSMSNKLSKLSLKWLSNKNLKLNCNAFFFFNLSFQLSNLSFFFFFFFLPLFFPSKSIHLDTSKFFFTFLFLQPSLFVTYFFPSFLKIISDLPTTIKPDLNDKKDDGCAC
mgnify:CR=1 FL=1